jgi:ABC-type spermidine/putrescine transport system permease subunit II
LGKAFCPTAVRRLSISLYLFTFLPFSIMVLFSFPKGKGNTFYFIPQAKAGFPPKK